MYIMAYAMPFYDWFIPSRQPVCTASPSPLHLLASPDYNTRIRCKSHSRPLDDRSPFNPTYTPPIHNSPIPHPPPRCSAHSSDYGNVALRRQFRQPLRDVYINTKSVATNPNVAPTLTRILTPMLIPTLTLGAYTVNPSSIPGSTLKCSF